MQNRVGIDIGGAFTDLVSINQDGEVESIKVDSTVEPEEGVINSIRSYGEKIRGVESILHGQTVVINSIVQKDGAKVGLITTKGFRDVLEIQRANRRDIYNLVYKKPSPFVPRNLRQEMEERIGADGEILVDIDLSKLEGIVSNFRREGVESVAVSFVNSYANDINEKKIKSKLLEMGYNFVTSSAEITKEWREYERTNTAVLNAFVQPRLKKYMGAVIDGAARKGFNGDFRIMLSNGGLANSDLIMNYPILTVESGPVAGIMGALKISKFAMPNEVLNIITLDGGSTTTKSSLIYKGLPRMSTNYNIGQDTFNAGYPLRIPVIDVVEVGNGGTSLAYVENGILKVGPKAAGAYPGPACYGRGGKNPTLTDAYVYAGLLDPDYFLAGKIKLNESLAEKALRELGKEIGLDSKQTADGIIRLANENAAYVLRIISVQKGYDPREFTLFPFGGAGSMLAPFIASDLRIERILIPSIPLGVFSAWGMLVSDTRYEKLKTITTQLRETNCNDVEREFKLLEEEILEQFDPDPSTRPSIIRYGDLRYKGQEHTIKVKLPAHIGIDNLKEIIELFHTAHQQEYTFRIDENPVELVNVHVVGLLENNEYRLKTWDSTGNGRQKTERDVYIDGKITRFPVYERSNLVTSMTIKGPAIIEEETATSILTKEQVGRVDKFGNILVRTG
ncbi:MAG: hydantoinase/oxoprolinase family protein [Candidatus Thermoplasmatota archaeon]|nr:hydantoinase/oxoprolinase family protein [Candidatus Thermoplasmatota archaeon]